MPDPIVFRGHVITHRCERTQEELPEHPGLLDYLLVHFLIDGGAAAGFAVDYRIPYERAASPPVRPDPDQETPEEAAVRKGMVAVRYLINEGETAGGELLEIVWIR